MNLQPSFGINPVTGLWTFFNFDPYEEPAKTIEVLQRAKSQLDQQPGSKTLKKQKQEEQTDKDNDQEQRKTREVVA